MSLDRSINKLEAFQNEIWAQKGKKILHDDADLLIELSTNLINNIQNYEFGCN
jgi:hypothetical protein